MSLVLGVFPFQGSAGFLQFCKKLDMPYDGYGRDTAGLAVKKQCNQGFAVRLEDQGTLWAPLLFGGYMLGCWGSRQPVVDAAG